MTYSKLQKLTLTEIVIKSGDYLPDDVKDLEEFLGKEVLDRKFVPPSSYHYSWNYEKVLVELGTFVKKFPRVKFETFDSVKVMVDLNFQE